MGLITIDGYILRRMIIAGANELTLNSREVDALNVFPVPDGDTGTNMSHTIQAAAREVQKLNTPHIHDVAKAASNGSLRGARGNSGVILSQLFRGFAKGLENKSVATNEALAEALVQSAETAYKAVMKPKEGTILTIARAAGEHAYACSYDEEDIETALASVIRHAEDVLEQTPDMLPALKQAGVVDSGGLGLIYILKGALAGLTMKEDPIPMDKQPEGNTMVSAAGASTADIKFVYCTEFLIDLHDTAKQADAERVLKGFLPGIGDSAVVVADDGVIKVHVHTNHPGQALEKALTFGSLTQIKIDNQREQHNAQLNFSASSKPPKFIGFVAVAAGAGLCELFNGLGADAVIEGGQTMNPSAEDIVKATQTVNAENVFILPNNKNIILTAQQAAELAPEGKNIHVIPTRSIPQGVSCLVSFVDSVTIDENIEVMTGAMDFVHSGQITTAVRDTVLDGRDIREGDILCMYDGDVALVCGEMGEAARALADYMLGKGGDVVSIYYGENVTETAAQELAGYILDNYPSSEVEVYNGRQPLYDYILSVE
jgi:hypothetical protein